MHTRKIWLMMLLAILTWGVTEAHVPKGYKRTKPQVQLRGVCATSESAIDQEINNVRARLLGGGDCWWDLNDGRYIVPKVDPASGQREVSSIFAASVWLGGRDPGNNLKLACQDYRPQGQNDFWPGPLDPNTGRTTEGDCKNWDRHFRVTGVEIAQHLLNLKEGKTDKSLIPRGVKGWPAKGNPYFSEVWQFALPNTAQGLAGFYDADEDGNYDPLKGDYPSIEIRGCDLTRYPDEMIFWIYNDEGSGSSHGRTKGAPIQMEVQVQSFGYQTADELNDMTFQRYKLINRATEFIDSTFFAMWVDPDLGCFLDDYIGCDTLNSLMYVYNQDATDGQPNCDCPDGGGGNVPTYCDNVPILGVDYFRGPRRPIQINDWETGELKDTLIEIGMSSFVYYNNPAYGNPPEGTRDPSQPEEFYNYLTGTWRDGTPFTYGGSGYNPGSTDYVKYAFTESPSDPTGWSMCTANLSFGDRRTLQASGPFRLKPGAQNELIIGVPWVPSAEYICPDIEQLLRADKLAQGLFDNCFERLTGPDAPTVNWVELNKQVVAVLTNEGITNNLNEGYEQVDFLAPDSIKFNPDPVKKELAKYKFEGYKIYQLANPNVSAQNYEDPDQSRLIYQVDKRNGVAKIFDWELLENPNDSTQRVYYPVERVDGANKGIRHTFSIEEDAFSTSNDKRLINHRKYYFSVVAYAYNNYETFDPLARPESGQQKPYLLGGKAQIYTVIPRPVVDQALASSYGDGVEITRLEGVGAGGNFLDVTDASRESMLSASYDSTIVYKPGRGPLGITIFNPFEVKDGVYEVAFTDSDLSDTKLDDTARWELRRTDVAGSPVIKSAKTIAELNEQIVAEYGFSVTISQTAETGNYTLAKDASNNLTSPGAKNGAIGAEVAYKDPNNPWLVGYAEEDDPSSFHFIKTRKNERDYDFDPEQGLSRMGNGWWVPYVLCDWDLPTGVIGPGSQPNIRMVTPAWTARIGGSVYVNPQAIGTVANSNQNDPNSRYWKLNRLPNVDIVLTSDKSKWSRCVVVETANEYYTGNLSGVVKDPTLVTESPTTRVRQMFDARFSPSVGKDDNNGDGLPDPDGAIEPDSIWDSAALPFPRNVANPRKGQPVLGMGWFPGYAVNVETGERLNVFFGENSCYAKSANNPLYTGRDMLWNPTSQILRGNTNQEINEFVFGGQHWVYVSNTPYDECEALRYKLTPEFYSGSTILTKKRDEVKKLAWCSMLQLGEGYEMKSLSAGLVPNDVTFKLRVENPFQNWSNDDDSNKFTGHPKYSFKIQGIERRELDVVQTEQALDSVKMVPNPYYGFSEYETSPLSNIVKITNLPAKCVVTIYSLDGKFIRQYKRDEQYVPYQQITPALEWDLKNSKGIPVASGVYLVHVNAFEKGERTLKWFGVARQFDPSGL